MQHGLIMKINIELFDTASLKLATNFLPDIFLKFFGKSLESQWVLTQHLFLYYYENKWLLNTKK